MPVFAYLNQNYPLDFCRACSYNATHNTNSNREETHASDAMRSAEGANLGLASPGETLRQKGPGYLYLWKVPPREAISHGTPTGQSFRYGLLMRLMGRPH